MATTYAAFNVTGEFVTNHARNLMFENKIREAERFLIECLTGMTHEFVIQILKGEKKIIGELIKNNVELADDDNKETKEFLKREFSGIVHSGQKYWKPYAYVNGWGPKDVGAGEYNNHSLYNYGIYGIPAAGSSRMTAFAQSRNVAYMDDKQRDIQHILKLGDGNQVILWKEVKCPPYWIEISQGSDWQKGLDNFINNGGKLSERNHSNTFENLDIFSDIRAAIKDLEDDELEETEDLEDDEKINHLDLNKKFLSDLGVPEHAQIGLSKILFGTEDEIQEPPKPANNVEIQHAKHGFILPNGDFYVCEYHHHKKLAERIYKHVLNKDFRPQKDKSSAEIDYEKEADADGWIRIQQSAISYDYNCVICRRPTNKQKSTFLFWAGMHGVAENELQIYHWAESESAIDDQ